MAIDLNSDWTVADVSALLASVEDDRSWRLEVSADGIARLHDLSTVPDAVMKTRCIASSRSGTRARTLSVRAPRATKACAGKIERILRENYPALKGVRTLSAL